MDRPNPQRYTTRDWVLGLILFTVVGAVTFALNRTLNSYLPNPPWLKTVGTVTSLVVGVTLIRERFKAPDR